MIKAAKKALDRRSFLRAVPAVPLAAPSIFEGFKGDMARGGGIAESIYSPPAPPVAAFDWFTVRRKELEAAIRGERSEEEQFYDRRPYDAMLAYHYDSLRSISPAGRGLLYADKMSKRDADQRKTAAKFHLVRFLKDNAGLFR